MLATVHTGMINYFYPGVFLGAKLFDLGDGAGFCCKMLQVKELFQQYIFPCPYLSASGAYNLNYNIYIYTVPETTLRPMRDITFNPDKSVWPPQRPHPPDQR